MISREEYEQTFVRMMDSLRDDEFKGKKGCSDVDCMKCPLKCACEFSIAKTVFNAIKIVEIVEQWGKEHPILTKAQKFKEVFGYEPKKENGLYTCPANIGKKPRDCSTRDCDDCRKEFWEYEYVEPNNENGTVTDLDVFSDDKMNKYEVATYYKKVVNVYANDEKETSLIASDNRLFLNDAPVKTILEREEIRLLK